MNIKVKLSLLILTITLAVATKNIQNAFIDTKLMKIPIDCLDVNNDGFYNKLDFNYEGINLYLASKKSFSLMDKKGAISETRKCDYVPPKDIDVKYLADTDCVNYCRLKVWIRSRI